MIDLNEVEGKIKSLSTMRGVRRSDLIKQISLNLISYSKEMNKPFLERNFLKTLFDNEDIRKQQRTIKAIFTFLLDRKMIAEDKKTKKLIYFRRTPTYSNDYESFSILMSVNGYYKNIFYFKGIKKVYLKKYVAFNMDDEQTINALNIDEDIKNKAVVEHKSYMSKARQGCRVMNNLSIKKSPQYIQNKTYIIL